MGACHLSCRPCLSRSVARKADAWLSGCAYRVEVAFDGIVRVCGPLYIALALTLILAVIYLGVTVILPAACDLRSPAGAAHLLLTAGLSYNILFNYYHCIVTDPGAPPDFQDLEVGTPLSTSFGTYAEPNGTTTIRWCKKCKKIKPPFTHHCHVCNRCILKMDHHCPWMSGCIGFHNYRFFFLFLLYLWLGCIYAAAMSTIPLLRSLNEPNGEPSTAVLFTFIMSAAILIALTVLLVWHVYLVATSQSTIDFYSNRQSRREARREGKVWANTFDMGVRQNFKNVFEVEGPWWCLLMVLPRASPLKGNGIHFPRWGVGGQSRESSAAFSRERGQKKVGIHSDQYSKDKS